MHRRMFLAGSLTLFVAPVVAKAQLTKSPPRIGFLAGGPTSPVEEFRRGLRERGYVEGQNVFVERRWTEGRAEAAARLAAELVGLQPDVLVAISGPPARAMKNATRVIPIVFAGVADPVATGLVSSLAKPGGNITGVAWEVTPEMGAKAVEILKSAIPQLTRIAVLWNPTQVGTERWVNTIEEGARLLGVGVTALAADSPARLDEVLQKITTDRLDGMIVMPDPLSGVHRLKIADAVIRQKLPDMYMTREYLDAGGLMSYGPNLGENIRRAAYYVDRILKGAKPGDLPVEQPTKFELVINLKTAKALGLTIPSTLLLRADHVIE